MDINQYHAKGKIKEHKFLNLEQLSTEEIVEILYMTKEQKIKKQYGENTTTLSGKNIALIKKGGFSTTELAFELGVKELSGYPVIIEQPKHLSNQNLKIMETYGVNAFVIEMKFEDAIKLNSATSTPIIDVNENNGPIHALTTIYSIWENKGYFNNLKVCFVGNVNTNGKQLITGLVKLGADVNIVSPSDCAPQEHFLSYCEQFSYVNHTDDINYGIKDADVVICAKHEFEESFLLDQFALSFAKENAIIFIPFSTTETKEIIVKEVLASKANKTFVQAENFIHVGKASLLLMVG